MKVISITNIKGGVGKSSSTATLAAGLANKGFRVLMIDSDPQCNLTMCFLSEQEDNTPSLYHVYAERKGIVDVKIGINERLDLVIGDFLLCNADMEFLRAGRLKMLDKALKSNSLEEEYDFVVIDTPPNLGVLSLNAFIASDYICVPMAADSFSLKGVRLLKQALVDVEEEIGRRIEIAGILLTKYNGRTNISKLLEKSLHSAAELLDSKVFDSRIRQAVVVQESQLAKEDLFSYAPKAPVTEDYMHFIDELLERIGMS